ncbi:hypothetical protein ES703_49766 [subsurface metagenome]
MKPRLLDLFCGAGGAAMGYHRAGFEVIGVDNKPQPHYPFEFHQEDALEFPLEGYAAYHASPPCQRFSQATPEGSRESHPDLIAATRERLAATAKPYVIENVRRAPLKATLMLCGTMFGLNVIRHRYFEMRPDGPFAPFSCNHIKKACRQGRAPKEGEYHVVGGNFSGVKLAREAMGIDWMVRDELSQAIPPAYTEYIGKYLMRALEDDRL